MRLFFLNILSFIFSVIAINAAYAQSGSCEKALIAHCAGPEHCKEANSPNKIFGDVQRVILLVKTLPDLSVKPYKSAEDAQADLPLSLQRANLTKKLADRFSKIYLRCVDSNSENKNEIIVLEDRRDPLIEQSGSLTIYVTLQTFTGSSPIAVLSFAFYRPDQLTLSAVTRYVPRIFPITGADADISKELERYLADITIF